MGQEVRKVGLKLFFGIFVMPYIFCWFLVRKGYSTISRVMGFGWALIFVALLMNRHENIQSSNQEKSLAPDVTQPQSVTENTNPEGTPLTVPSDAQAQYFILKKGGTAILPTITTKRIGSSGTSYSKRIYNCKDNTVKYLGTGDTLAEMNASAPEAKMYEIVDKSIAYYVGLQACDNIPVNNAASDAANDLIMNSKWRYSQSDDPMSKGKTNHASVISSNTVEFGFPYNGKQNATLTLRIDPKYGKDVIFSIEKGQILCSSYDGCNVLVRFDDDKATNYSAAAPADNSTDTIFIRNYSKFVEKISKAKRVRISTNIYQEGNPVFEFDVSGFDRDEFNK